MRRWILGLAWTFFAGGGAAFAQEPVTIPLWPHGVPGNAAPGAIAEHDTTKDTDNLIAGRRVERLGNVSTPTVTFYRPTTPALTSGKMPAVLVFPGGGYQILAWDLEGTEVCHWLNSIGVGCALLKYRVPESGPFPLHAEALQDAQRGMRLVRAHAAAWGIDPRRVGVLGFSAGGHLVAALGSHAADDLYPAVDAADQQSAAPDFSVLIYPGYLNEKGDLTRVSPDIKPNGQTPPSFLVQAEDDPVHVENVLVYYEALKQAKVPAEMHVYAVGGHGYGLRPTSLPVTHWPELARTWLHTIGVLP
jgi:acetyl esterase/lipase